MFDVTPLTQALSPQTMASLRERRKAGEFAQGHRMGRVVVYIIAGVLAVSAGIGFLVFIGYMVSLVWDMLFLRSGLIVAAFLLIPLSIAALIIGAIIFAGRWTWRKWKQRNGWMWLAAFADHNNMRYAIRQEGPPGFDALMFRRSNDGERLLDHFQTRDQPTLDVGIYQWDVDSTDSDGDTNTTSYNTSFGCFQLAHRMPNMFFDARGNESFLNRLAADLGRRQRVSMGDPFDQHFTLYVPDDARPQAWLVLPPDLMQMFLDVPRCFDIEISGDRLIISTPGKIDFHHPAEWWVFDYVRNRLVPRLNQMVSRHAEGALQPFVDDTMDRSVQRLKRRFPWRSVITMTVLLLVWFFLLVMHGQWPF